ncbi:hypothetical protein C1T31_07430 [Hanstruepera neustonica]|uniref:Uncharacterized protein n=1 Tax=Hanstruepera neustonica TaxID=1445657 RepID=A0A2K1DZ97_9FLAO|nr:hypothetical protein C1T31_07430 [Hanstruepera neustonica]
MKSTKIFAPWAAINLTSNHYSKPTAYFLSIRFAICTTDNAYISYFSNLLKTLLTNQKPYEP